jgi:predicted nucleotidyltransferase
MNMVSISKQLIENMVQAVVEEVRPQRIYLFGSCARDNYTPNSDVDLLIVEQDEFGPERNRWSELKRIRKALKPFHVPKDVLVYSQDEFERWEGSINHIISHAVREGNLIYERS